MTPQSPAEALGPHTGFLRDKAAELVATRHNYAADGHEASHTRTAQGYGTLWRDLLADFVETLCNLGFQSYPLSPGGYKVAAVNGCLVYPWRIPANGTPSLFASSPTRASSFNAPIPDPALFDATLPDSDAAQSSADGQEITELKEIIESASGTMPVILVYFKSSPGHLGAIRWALAELNDQTDEVDLIGEEVIWSPDAVGAQTVSATGADKPRRFDDGELEDLPIEPREEERPQSDD